MSENKDILLSKWLQGNITDDELRLLKQEYDLDELDAVLKAQKEYDFDTIPQEEMWENFQNKLDLEEVEQLKKGRTNLLLPLLLIIVTILGLGVFYLMKPKGIKTNTNEQKVHQFADGTKVNLGPESSLTFKESNWKNERRLQLSGQAFFDVEKGNSFIVETKAGDVTVLGTQFDIWQIHNKYLRVQCYEGSVSVKTNGKSPITIKAGEEITLNNNVLSEVKAIVKTNSDWLDQERHFEGLPAYLVIGDMRRFYGKIFFLPKEFEDEIFSGYLPTDNLEGMLKKFAVPNSWQWEEKNGKYYFK
jgi:ferric-dicitrate binding protein FerR (iron transport regulator)